MSNLEGECLATIDLTKADPQRPSFRAKRGISLRYTGRGSERFLTARTPSGMTRQF
jgi:hypothetical protein